MLTMSDATLPAVCSALATQGSEATLPSKPPVETGSPVGPGSADDLQTSQDDDDGLEVFEEHSGGEKHGIALFGTTRTLRTQKVLSVRKIELKTWWSGGKWLLQCHTMRRCLVWLSLDVC